MNVVRMWIQQQDSRVDVLMRTDVSDDRTCDKRERKVDLDGIAFPHHISHPGQLSLAIP